MSGLSIDQIESAPFSSQLVVSSGGDRIAWVVNDRGSRNLWIGILKGKEFDTRRLTSFEGDDGIALADPSWSADGHVVFYTRGGDEGGRIAVNPAADWRGPAAGTVWRTDLDGASRALAAGYAPAPAPRGRNVIFLRDGQPWQIDDTGTVEATRLFIDQGQVQGLAWSPDGTRIAFVSIRDGNHSVIGIYTVATRRIVWAAPSFARDRSPVWSPSGRSLAFIRLAIDGDRREFFPNPTSRVPWGLVVVDAECGSGNMVWRAPSGRGSQYRQLLQGPPLQWSGDDRLVFPWERSGWLRLYALALGQSTIRPLSPDGAEVFNAVVDRTGKAVTFSTNAGDIDRRHIWIATVASGRALQMTRSDGVEDMPIPLVNGNIVAMHGGPRRPVRPVMIANGTFMDVAPTLIPADYPSDSLIVPQNVTFDASDGTKVHGQLFLPPVRSRPRPAILFFHGGPTNRQMFPSWDPFEVHSHLYASCQYLAAHGYIVLSVNYRGGAGYGLSFREAPGLGPAGASEGQDIAAAADFLRERGDVDPSRIGVWGGSYGGRMASLAMTLEGQNFAAAVDYAGAHDWTTMPGVTLRPGESEQASLSGAMSGVARWRAPVLLIHGDDDRDVPIEQTFALAAALCDNGTEVQEYIVPNEVHFMLLHRSWISVFTRMRVFFDDKLKPRN